MLDHALVEKIAGEVAHALADQNSESTIGLGCNVQGLDVRINDAPLLRPIIPNTCMAEDEAPSETNSQYESRAETEAAVERIHECFKYIRAAIAKEKVEKTSAAADSHRGQPQSALDLPAKI
jgi:hypothetical protein